MRSNKVSMQEDAFEGTEQQEILYPMPKLYIRRWNRCLWILIVSLVLTALMLGTMIPGIVGLAQGDNFDDTLLYLGLIAFIFAGLFLTLWYLCQIETTDPDYFERAVAQKSVKRRDDGHRHMRPKSLRAPLSSTSSVKHEDEHLERTSLVNDHVML